MSARNLSVTQIADVYLQFIGKEGHFQDEERDGSEGNWMLGQYNPTLCPLSRFFNLGLVVLNFRVFYEVIDQLISLRS
jgi:hypothetical protein